MDNLKRLKKDTNSWDKEKKIREDSKLSGIESWLSSMMEGEGLGFQSESSKVELVQKDKR